MIKKNKKKKYVPRKYEHYFENDRLYKFHPELKEMLQNFNEISFIIKSLRTLDCVGRIALNPTKEASTRVYFYDWIYEAIDFLELLNKPMSELKQLKSSELRELKEKINLSNGFLLELVEEIRIIDDTDGIIDADSTLRSFIDNTTDDNTTEEDKENDRK